MASLRKKLNDNGTLPIFWSAVRFLNGRGWRFATLGAVLIAAAITAWRFF